MSIAAWLRHLGLERYIEAFEEHDVADHTLPHLTEADLLAIGVKSVGHRRKLLEAIAALEAKPPASRSACWPRSTSGSTKGSTRPTSSRLGHC